MKRRIDPKETPTKDLHQYILGSIAPRPIAFVSSVNEDGVKNLAPYSFFNAFSSNPPIAVFSSNRKVADNTTKDTLHNAEVQKELVINMVSYNIVRQMAISSVSYPTEVSEFEKTGLTPLPSELVNAPRVAESPVNMECRVKEIITLGDKGGAFPEAAPIQEGMDQYTAHLRAKELIAAGDTEEGENTKTCFVPICRLLLKNNVIELTENVTLSKNVLLKLPSPTFHLDPCLAPL